MEDVSLELHAWVKQRLKGCTRMQQLAAAVLGIERMWQVFQDWTAQESIPYLKCSPQRFRMPFRLALDLLWEQVEAGQEYNGHREVFDRLYEFVENSYEEDDALDVDFGSASLFIDELVSGGIAGFFPIRAERQLSAPWNAPDFYEDCAARFVALYAEQLFQYLNDWYVEQSAETLTESELSTKIAQDVLWVAERERMESDLTLVQGYPANREAVAKRLGENRNLRTPPFCAEC